MNLLHEIMTWLSALATCGGSVEVFCWRPDDWEQILEILR